MSTISEKLARATKRLQNKTKTKWEVVTNDADEKAAETRAASSEWYAAQTPEGQELVLKSWVYQAGLARTLAEAGVTPSRLREANEWARNQLNAGADRATTGAAWKAMIFGAAAMPAEVEATDDDTSEEDPGRAVPVVALVRHVDLTNETPAPRPTVDDKSKAVKAPTKRGRKPAAAKVETPAQSSRAKLELVHPPEESSVPPPEFVDELAESRARLLAANFTPEEVDRMLQGVP